MTPQHVISQLLSDDAKQHRNLDLLKKIILTAYLGRLQVNGLSPDNKVALGNYLFDDERLMFDFSRLSESKKEQFQKWLLDPHQKEKEKSYLSNDAVNEYRGFTAEMNLSWWGRFTNWMKGYFIEHWKIKDLDLSLNYQLLGINMCHGLHGTSIGFNQFLVPSSGTKYKAEEDLQEGSLGNTKRVLITDKLVDQLTKCNLSSLKFESVCKGPHPLAIHVADMEGRHKEMHNYRIMQRYHTLNPWYVRAWNWVCSWFISEPLVKKASPQANNKLTLLYQNETTTIYKRGDSQGILVKEKRPDIENLVFCGGGAKIFAHIGVWKALNEINVSPKQFAGSSAGAIMATLCYLGFSADQIAGLFKHFKQENLVYFDIDSSGLSDSHALKTALDYGIALKLTEIVERYKIPYPQGKITFNTLEQLRLSCPGCGIGNKLIVTATNMRQRKTHYFSMDKTPDMEVSEAVKISASFPVIFKKTLLNGEEYNDGGILSNFPTEAFHADDTSFLESEYGNNMKTLGVQFDNGTERSTIDRAMEKVYRENFLMNWIYGMLTGVSDPASGWEQDRMKLRKYAAQSIIVDVGEISSSGFSVEESMQVQLINSGYKTAKEYLQARFAKKPKGSYKNKEMMHSTFASLGELLAYCCYRGDQPWFDVVSDLIINSSLPNKAALIKQSHELRALYFARKVATTEVGKQSSTPEVTFFGNEVVVHPPSKTDNRKKHAILLALYPIFLKLTPDLLTNPHDKECLLAARSSFTLDTPFRCLSIFSQIKNETHIIFHIFANLVKSLKKEPSESVYAALKLVQKILDSNKGLVQKEFYAHWNLDFRQGLRVLKLFCADQTYNSTLINLCQSLLSNEEPLQKITGEEFREGEDELVEPQFSSITPQK